MSDPFLLDLLELGCVLELLLLNFLFKFLDLVFQLNNLGGSLIDLVVSGKKDLAVIHELHLNVVGSAMKELVKHILEDLVLSPGQVDLTVLLLDSKDRGLQLDLLDETLQKGDVNDAGPAVGGLADQALQCVEVIDLAHPRRSDLVFLGERVVHELVRGLIIDDLLDLIHDSKLRLQIDVYLRELGLVVAILVDEMRNVFAALNRLLLLDLELLYHFVDGLLEKCQRCLAELLVLRCLELVDQRFCEKVSEEHEKVHDE